MKTPKEIRALAIRVISQSPDEGHFLEPFRALLCRYGCPQLVSVTPELSDALYEELEGMLATPEES